MSEKVTVDRSIRLVLQQALAALNNTDTPRHTTQWEAECSAKLNIRKALAEQLVSLRGLQRYEPEIFREDRIRMEPDSAGDWVKWEDLIAEVLPVNFQLKKQPTKPAALTVWAAQYVDCFYEGDYATLSLHTTPELAQAVIAAHRAKEKALFEECEIESVLFSASIGLSREQRKWDEETGGGSQGWRVYKYRIEELESLRPEEATEVLEVEHNTGTKK